MSGQDAVNAMRARRDIVKPPRSGGRLDLILTVVAVLAIGCCAFYGYGYISGQPSGNGPSINPVSAASADTVQVAWTAEDTARCVAAGRNAARSPDPRAAEHASMGIPSITDGGFARLATTTRCIARTKISRLCDPAEKAVFIQAMNDYITRFDVVLMGLQAQAGIVSAAGGMMGGEAAFGSAVMDIQTEATLNYMRVYHRDLAMSLKELARAGLLTTGDFGGGLFGASGTITSILDGVTPTYNLCQ